MFVLIKVNDLYSFFSSFHNLLTMSVVTKFMAASTGLLTSGLATLHYKFGLRLRNINLDSDNQDLKKMENNDIGLPSKFSILSQNTWCSFVYGGPKRKQRLQLLIDNISKDNPDILCLQEMFMFALGPFLVCGDFKYLHDELVNNMGYKYYSDPKQTLPTIWGGNNGLMIYSKYKINECKSYSFDNKIRRRFSAKGWISAKLKMDNDDTLQIINTHLEHSNRDYKLKQLDVIKETINNDDNGNDKYRMCLGDFNICSRHTFENDYQRPKRLYDILETIMSDNGLKYDLFNGVERTFRKTKEEPHSCWDHIFVNQNVKSIVDGTYVMDYSDDDLNMSDHYGLLVEMDRDLSQNKLKVDST